MRKSLMFALAFVAVAEPAIADQWAGESSSLRAIPVQYAYTLPGYLAEVQDAFPAVRGYYQQYGFACYAHGDPVSAPPCTGGTTLGYAPTNFTTTSVLPGGISGPGSRVGIEVSGYFPDPSAPAGFSSFSGTLPLSDFASTASLNALQNQISSNMAVLNTQLKHYAAQGVAQALAMAGVGDIDADQKVSISMNFGTYEGQSAAAMGIAVRLDHHVSFNAGMSGMGSGTYGARAGFRIGW